ncbi:hypothetical protein PYW07_013230 [Mythimna separata]|uniref:FP protein C-terminal domain-containing protein n=1 Tax=Mythimna separata TaxID=271217 RepID=A0AAD7Y5W4_MYTSE|nr:hypothetical protein PYW07_013230 [Mythimna separata]
MDHSMNKSMSESEISTAGTLTTPPNFVFQRYKRGYGDMEDSLSKQLDLFREEIRKMLSSFTDKQEKKTQEINAKLHEIQQSNTHIEKSIEFLTAQNKDLHEKITRLEMQTKEDKNYISILENKIEDMQTESRKSNLVIKNVPRKKGTKEDLLEMAMCLFQSIQCSIKKHDIKDIYRVRGKTTEKQNTPIVVETGSTILKTESLKMAKAFNIKHQHKLSCKHMGFKTQEDTPVFISEHLTAKGSRLHFLARDLIKSGTYKFCWTAYGKVYVRKDENSPTIILRSEEQVHKLVLQK